jgi:glutathione S-transferase
MKLYGFAFAPNPRKLFVYMQEKGLDFEWVPVDLPAGEHRQDWFRKKNPMLSLPVLELDDGRCLTESLPIIEYLEESFPDPPLIGTDPLTRYHTRELERLCEMSILMRVGRIFRNSNPMFAGPNQIRQLADTAKEELPGVLAILDEMVGGNEFVAGSRPTIADCTLFAAFKLAQVGGIEIDSSATNLARWWANFQVRLSAADPA